MSEGVTEDQRRFSDDEWRAIHNAIVRLRASVMAVVCGAMAGVTLFVATIWLVLRGPASGQTKIGPHLSLLDNYLPGYEVSLLGSFVGLFYGLLIGGVVGWSIAFVYNSIVDLRWGDR